MNPKKFQTLGKLIDAIAIFDRSLDKLARAEKQIKAEQDKIKEKILKSFKHAEIEAATGRLARAYVSKEPVPNVDDWKKVYAYILRTKEFDLLHKRISRTAWAERMEAKSPIPGISVFTVVSLKLKKLKKK